MISLDGRSVAVPSCNHKGALVKNYYDIVEVVGVVNTSDDEVAFLTYTCDEGALAKSRIDIVASQPRRSDAELVELEVNERRTECVHAQAVRQLLPNVLSPRSREERERLDMDGAVMDPLQDRPLMFAIKCSTGTYGVVVKGTVHWTCRMCNRLVCPHTAALKGSAEFSELDLDAVGEGTPDVVKSVSSRRIAFPLRQVDDPTSLPDVLMEGADGVCGCDEKNPWSSADPLKQKWIRKKGNNK